MKVIRTKTKLSDEELAFLVDIEEDEPAAEFDKKASDLDDEAVVFSEHDSTEGESSYIEFPVMKLIVAKIRRRSGVE